MTKSGVIWTELRPVSGIAIFDSSVAMMQEILWKAGEGANYSLVLPDTIKNEGANYSLVLPDTNKNEGSNYSLVLPDTNKK